MSATDTPAPDFEAQVGEYAERLFGMGLAAMEAANICLGRQLGLYQALADQAQGTAAEVAAAAGTDVRYTREWLEQQATAGLIDVVGITTEADHRRFELSPAAEECLLKPDSLNSVGPIFDFLPPLGAILPQLAEAFRSGAGVPYADYAVHDAQGDFNRPAFLNLLPGEWINHIPDLAEKLAGGGEVRIAEIGSGEGWAAIGIAKAWPNARVDGFDLDDASVAKARKLAAEAGVADRVSFEVADVTGDLASVPGAGNYDAVFAFEMIHDLANPQAALRGMRALAKAGAPIIVMDENAAEAFEPATENPIERLLYAVSVLHCLPVGRTEANSACTGTVMRPDTFRRYATEAGYSGVDILPIEFPFFRFYRLND